MKCTYNTFLEALRDRWGPEVAIKFIGTPTSRGHVEFPLLKPAQTFFFVPPPTTSNTHRPTASIWSDGLDASMTLLTQPQVHLHCPQSP